MDDTAPITAAVPAALAGQIENAMWALLDATRSASNALTYPSDVYDVVAHLASLADALPRVLDQMSGWLERGIHGFEVNDGIFTGDPVAAVATTQALLDDARSAAAMLGQQLHEARRTLEHLTAT